MKKNNKWKLLVDFIRSHEIGDVITRQEIITIIMKTNVVNTPFSIDAYINLLRRCGVLKTEKQGHYKLVRKLVKNIKLTVIHNYIKNDFKAWFCNDIFED